MPLITRYFQTSLPAIKTSLGSAVQPQNQQGFMLWFKTLFQPNSFHKLHSNPQTLCSERFLFKYVKCDFYLLVMKSLAAMR